MTAESIAARTPKQNAVLAELLEHREEFLGLLIRRASDPAVADDILQADYTKALQKGEYIQNVESVVAWFYRMLRNAVVGDYRRNDGRTRAHQPFVTEAPLNYENEVEANLSACVEGVVQTLKPEYRTVVKRIDLRGESIADFGQFEGTTANNASVRLHRARRAAVKKLTQVCGPCADHRCLDCTCKRRV